jgi:hypothetical protein
MTKTCNNCQKEFEAQSSQTVTYCNECIEELKKDENNRRLQSERD